MKYIIVLLSVLLVGNISRAQYGVDSVTVEDFYEEVKLNGGGYASIQQWPMYPHGREGITRHIKENLKYPDEAFDDRIEGQVLVGYTIGPDGNVSGIKVIRGVHPSLDEEAVRVISTMEVWRPALRKDKPIQMFFQQAIDFKIKEAVEEKAQVQEAGK